MKKLFLIIVLIIAGTNISNAQTLSFNDILNVAMQNSYDLKIAKSNINASKSGVKEARADYFPVINAGYNTQYDKDLTNGTSTITSVGDTVLLDRSRYQNALSTSLQYNLFDFGVRNRKLKIAKKERDQKEIEYDKSLRDLKISVADTYTHALLASRELSSNEEALSLEKQLFTKYENLYEAGTVRKTDVMEQALKVAKLTNKIDELKTEYKKTLEDLSYYTEQEYNPDEVQFLRMNELEFIPVNYIKPDKFEIKAEKSDIFDLESLPEYKIYQLEIEKKKAELQILNRQRLPQFNFLTSYYLYGTDPNDYWKSYGDLSQRNLSFRIATSLPIFDGFKNQARRERAKEEIITLELQRDKKLKDIKTYYKKLTRESEDFGDTLQNQQDSLIAIKEKIVMIERLYSEGLIKELDYLSQKSELVNQEFELEKIVINNDAAEYKIKVLKGNGNEEKQALPGNDSSSSELSAPSEIKNSGDNE